MADRKLRDEDVRRLYDQYGSGLLAYASSFVANGAAGEDIVHQVFLRLLQGDIVAPDAPVAYLYRAVRNAALNARRKEEREVTQDAASDERKTFFECHDGNREAALALQAALLELPDEQREIVVLRIWSGMTLEEAAALTGVPLNTVASRYRYALNKLRERLKPYEKE